jgi:hypothetical protein
LLERCRSFLSLFSEVLYQGKLVAMNSENGIEHLIAWLVALGIVGGIAGWSISKSGGAGKTGKNKKQVGNERSGRPKLRIVRSDTQGASDAKTNAGSQPKPDLSQVPFVRSRLKASSIPIAIIVSWAAVYLAPYPVSEYVRPFAVLLTVGYAGVIVVISVLAMRDAEQLRVESFIKRGRFLSQIIPGSFGVFWQLASQAVHIYARGDGLRAYQILEQARQRLITPLRFLAGYTQMLGERVLDDRLGITKAAKYITECRPTLGVASALKIALSEAYLERNILPTALETLSASVRESRGLFRDLVLTNFCAALGLEEELPRLLEQFEYVYVRKYYEAKCKLAHGYREDAEQLLQEAAALLPECTEGLQEETIVSNIYRQRILRALKRFDDNDVPRPEPAQIEAFRSILASVK